MNNARGNSPQRHRRRGAVAEKSLLVFAQNEFGVLRLVAAFIFETKAMPCHRAPKKRFFMRGNYDV
jgi:hypothetical protein